MSTPEDIVRRLNSEDCELATGLCLREYRERDCWICILKEYTNEIYNNALEDLREKLLDTISHKYNYPYFDDAIYGLVNDALVDSIEKLKQ